MDRIIKIMDFEDGTKLEIHLTKCYGEDYKGSIMNRWVKSGTVPRFLNTWTNITTYYTDKEGNCIGRYNPSLKNRRYIFEWNEENNARVLEDIERMADEDGLIIKSVSTEIVNF